MRRHALEDGEDLDNDRPFVMRNAPRTRFIDEISDEEAGLIAEARSPPGLEHLNDLLDE